MDIFLKAIRRGTMQHMNYQKTLQIKQLKERSRTFLVDDTCVYS